MGSGCPPPGKFPASKTSFPAFLYTFMHQFTAEIHVLFSLCKEKKPHDNSKYVKKYDGKVCCMSWRIFKWVYGNPGAFLVSILRIPAYHVDYTAGIGYSRETFLIDRGTKLDTTLGQWETHSARPVQGRWQRPLGSWRDNPGYAT